ncbi:MAG: ATP-binding protein [Candidatus Parvarchaeota archaeon]
MSSVKNNVISFVSREIYNKSDIPAIQAQEVFQNAVDAVRSALKEHLIKEGRIDVYVDYDSITVKDNGIGMTEEELKNGFGVYGRSNKIGDLDSIGMYGIGVKSVMNSSVMEIETVKNGILIKARASRSVLHIISIEPTDLPPGTTVKFVLGMRKLNYPFLPPIFLGYGQVLDDYIVRDTNFLPVKFAERIIELAFYLPFYDDRIIVYFNGERVSPSTDFINSFYYKMNFAGGKLYICALPQPTHLVLNIKGISYSVLDIVKRKSDDTYVYGVKRILESIKLRTIQSVFVTSLIDVTASRNEVSNFPALEKILIGYNSEPDDLTPVERKPYWLRGNNPPTGVTKTLNIVDFIDIFKVVVKTVFDNEWDDITQDMVKQMDFRTFALTVKALKKGIPPADEIEQKIISVINSLKHHFENFGFDIPDDLLVNIFLVNALFKTFEEAYVDRDGFLSMNPEDFVEENKIRGDEIRPIAYPIPNWLRSVYFKELLKINPENIYQENGNKYFIPYLKSYYLDELIGIFDFVLKNSRDITEKSISEDKSSDDSVPSDQFELITLERDTGMRNRKVVHRPRPKKLVPTSTLFDFGS